MSEIQQISEQNRCYCCLSTNNERRLYIYNIHNKILKLILRLECLVLCYVCMNIAAKTEMLVKNIEYHQNVLEQKDTSQNLAMETQRNAIVDLIRTTPNIIDTSENEELFIEIKLEKEDSEEEQSMDRPDLALESNVKAELHSDNEVSNHPLCLSTKDQYSNETNNFTLQNQMADIPKASVPSEMNVNDEDSFEHFEPNIEITEDSNEWNGDYDFENNDNDDLKSGSDFSDSGFQNPFQDPAKEMQDLKIERIFITIEQCMEERRLKAAEKNYVEATFKCEDCIQIFSIKETYEEHMKLHKESCGTYVCDVCKKRTRTPTQLSLHYKYHTERYKCSKCDYIGKGKLSAKDHYVKHHCSEDYYPYACKHCGKQYRFTMSLKSHLWTKHAQKRKYNCNYCEKSYPIKSTLREHIFKKHANAPKKFVCDECGAGFVLKKNLKRHLGKHSTQRDHFCVKCNKGFKTETALKAHFLSRVHGGEYTLPFSCPLCGKGFRARRDLTRHVNGFHLNIRPFKCEQCEKTFKNKYDVQEHRKRVHEGYRCRTEHKCTYCPKIFNKTQSLEDHIRTHTGERPFQCTQCSSKFTQSGTLYTHIRMVHLKLTKTKGTKKNAAGPKKNTAGTKNNTAGTKNNTAEPKSSTE